VPVVRVVDGVPAPGLLLPSCNSSDYTSACTLTGVCSPHSLEAGGLLDKSLDHGSELETELEPSSDWVRVPSNWQVQLQLNKCMLIWHVHAFISS
jgi:hypothetical protein